MRNSDLTPPGPVGFIGLGAMGGPMARKLCEAGYHVTGYDLNPERLRECVAAGVAAASNVADVVTELDIVLISLRTSEAWVQLAEEHLIPLARPGQVFVDLGTVAAPQTRRVALRLAERSAALVDAPVSGGPAGAQSGTLRIFVGGDPEPVRRVWPVLQVLGDPERIVHYGPSGCGQVVKGCNQLAMGLADAAYMEALAFAASHGLDPRMVAQGVGGPDGWRGHFAHLAQQIAAGRADQCYVKYPELPYFLEEANEQGRPMPLTQALYGFGIGLPKDNRDNMDRPTIAFWRALTENRE